MANLNANTNTESMASPRQRDENKFSTNFLVKIVSSQQGVVVARAPEELSMTLSSEWDSALSGGGGSGFGVIVAETLGVSTRNQYSSAQVWSGNSPIELTIPLEFYAEKDSKREIINPIVKLARMALPRFSSDKKIGIKGFGEVSLFVPPGPRIFNTNAEANDQITIKIGKFLTFKKVIITNINPVFSTREMHSSGMPLRATCEVTFRTIFSLTGNDFDKMFEG